ncbi:MAG: HEAT repeat domain-containing protein [Gemmataceae bacterium]
MRKVTWFILLAGLLACGCSKTKSTDQLIADLKSGEEKQRLIAARLLGQRHAEPAKVVPALTEALSDHDGDVRWSAAIGLGYFGEQAKDAVPALQKAQQDKDGRVREGAAVALSRIDPAKFPYSAAKPKSPKK